MSDEKVLVCTRVEDMGIPVEGSKTLTCADCGKDVWVSPATYLEHGHEAITVCMVCAIPRIKADPDAKVMPVTEDQIEELRRHYDDH